MYKTPFVTNIALARKELPRECEKLLHNKKTLTEVREVVACNPEFDEALIDSIQQVLCTLSQHLSSMEVKAEMDMKQFWEQIFEI